ncbi:hypothetical protein [Haloplanus vescus]|nr:hypothetical protein [Haloplanus vescus]
MNTPLLELLPQLVELLAFAFGSLGLSAAGVYLERFALTTLETGNAKLGGWIAFMGLMAFYFAYLMSTDKVRPKLAAVRRQAGE